MFFMFQSSTTLIHFLKSDLFGLKLQLEEQVIQTAGVKCMA